MRKVHGDRAGRGRIGQYVCTECGTTLPAIKALKSLKGACKICGSEKIVYMASAAESKRFNELMVLRRIGEIKNLEIQPQYPLFAATMNDEGGHDPVGIGTWKADFQYVDKSGKLVVEDVKGNVDTHLSAWKRKHFEAQYGLKVSLIRTGKR